jgi:tetratricopeptide (TPR) repeat protein
MTETDPKTIAESATRHYEQGDFEQSARLFAEAALAYEQAQNLFDAAEMRNNQSVALLKGGDAQAALDALQGLGDVFEQANDVYRQAFFIGNKAAALESLGRLEEAEQCYRDSAQLLEAVAEYQLRATINKSLALVCLRRFKLLDSVRAYGAYLKHTIAFAYFRARVWFPSRK